MKWQTNKKEGEEVDILMETLLDAFSFIKVSSMIKTKIYTYLNQVLLPKKTLFCATWRKSFA